MERRLLLDVVIGKSAFILQLLPRKNQTLLVGRDPLLVLDLLLDIRNRITRLSIERDGLSRKRLHEDLHPYVSSLEVWL